MADLGPDQLSPTELRRAYRLFVLTHHPDRGGDRDTFERGLAAYRRAQQPTTPGTVVFARRPGLGRSARRWWRRRGKPARKLA